MRTSRQRGFTLIELMIVVVIIGILAAIAIPMFMDNARKAKTTEAQLQLNMLAKNAKAYYQTTTRFPSGTAGVLPGADGAACRAAGRKFPVIDWSTDPVWSELSFHIDEPNLFTYHYTSTSSNAATATAVGDLDCDGMMLVYRLELTVPEGTPAAVQLQDPASAD